MASDKRDGRDDRSKRGANDPRRRRAGVPFAEPLESRRLLTTSPAWHATNSNPFDVQNGPLANLGATLIGVYKDYSTYVNAGSHGTYTPAAAKSIYFKGTSVGVDVIGLGDQATVKTTLTALGMNITGTNTLTGVVEGYIPIANLPKLAVSAQVRSASPLLKPANNAYPYQGAGNNEGANTLNVPTNVVAGVVNGTGQKIAVLSDSVNENTDTGGLAASQKTGDLGAVQIIQDGTTGDTDEGRAMLEEIHDVAPGAALAFATDEGGETNAGNNIQSLYNAGYTTIVDDFHYPDEPVYQDGIVAQAVNSVVASGGTYVASAGNSADDGYESQFRGVSATVGSLGTGTYMNFDGSGATTTTQLGVYVPDNSGPNLYLQFDQPYYGGATSDVEVYLLNSSGAIAYSGTTNTAATGVPIQALLDSNNASAIAAGTYSLVIKVVSGPNPGHVDVYNPTDGTVAFDHSFGSAGGTYYPTTNGHNAAANTISVGALPFWGASPYISTTSPKSESFSSFGPVLSLFNPDGSAKTAQTLNKPDVSAPDDVNTSFFIPGQLIDTTQVIFPANPVYPGNPVTTFPNPTTTTNQAQPTLPTFSGTSAAAPNLAAVVALMKQANPTITRTQILADLIATTTAMNNTTKGTWNPQSGYGLANATAAIALASNLQVNSTTPGEAATITASPSVITVNFSKAVNFATLSAASITVTGPNGVTVTVGAPVGVDSTTFPTVVQFPIVIHPVGKQIANGVYTVNIPAGTIKAQDGTTLTTAFRTTFNLQDTVPPRIVATTFSGRIVTATFSEPVNAAYVNASSFYLIRAGGTGNALFNSADVIVSNLPGAVVSYNAATLTATIDLTNVAQSQLPSDHYGLVATTAIVDYVNNPLNGQFSGVFPSGIANPVVGVGTTFVQDLGVITVQAPVITALILNPTTDSGVLGDSDTNFNRPSFVGQIASSFLAAQAGLTVYAQFNGIAHPGVALGGLNLAAGAGGRGVVGTYDVVTTTDAIGRFVINYPAGVTALPEGQNIIRAAVVGAPDAGGVGLTYLANTSFQVDRTLAYVNTVELNGAPTTNVAENSNNNNLSTASFYVTDPVNPTSLTSPFAVNAQSKITALNPATANNILNYSLYLITGTTTFTDESGFIKSATFVSTSNRVLTSDPLTGRVDLTFASGLPQGRYQLIARGPATAPTAGGGITDAAANSLTDSAADSATGTAKPFVVDFNLQPTPTYITGYTAYSSYTSPTSYGVTSGPRASYEIPATGVTAGAPAPPTAFTIDFSNQLSAASIATVANEVILARSTNPATGSLPDGDFGNFGTAAGLTNPTGYTRVTGLTISVVNQIPGAVAGQQGYLNRILIQVPAGTTLPADYYRVYLPNTSNTTGTTTQPIVDIYGNQLDGEFQGYQNSAGKYVDQLNTGVVRGSGTFDQPDLSGDGTAGGAFVTGFVVVPNGNIIYARPDAIYNPQLPGSYPDGSAAKPYPVLAPEATPTALNGGDLNSSVNSGVNFDSTYDRSGLGTFQPSAFFAAQEKARLTQAPVVIIAEPALLTRDPLTGIVAQRPFVLQAPTPVNGATSIANDGSAAIPAMTTLIFAAGSTLKMQNAALLVQNQGSALQILGGANPGQIVTVTSYKDSSVGGATNGDASSQPASGDYGGILFRNYDQAAGESALNTVGRTTLFPGQIATTGNLNFDGRLKGPFANTTSRTSQVDAVSGADDVMSYIDDLNEKYAGGDVPQSGPYDGITLKNSRPTIINSSVSLAGTGSANAGLSEDVDSTRLDDVAAGPLFRNLTLTGNGINGVFLRGNLASGLVTATNATNVGTTATSFGTSETFVLNAYIPYVLTASLVIGDGLQVETQGNLVARNDRLYVTPGSIIKFVSGTGMEVTPGASINIGDQTYIKNYDLLNSYSPATAGFKANSAGLAPVIFTSYYDDAATTTYTDPQTLITTTVTPALPTVPGGSGTSLPSAGNVPDPARWSGLTIDSGAIGVVNSAVFRYGGGVLNTLEGTDAGVDSFDLHHALEIGGGGFNSIAHFAVNYFGLDGAHVMVTNSTFTDNDDVGLDLDPNALLAADPTRPLQSGDPFIHGNIFLRNTSVRAASAFQGTQFNGVGVAGGTGIPIAATHAPNLEVNSTWTGGDFTYILRDTIVLGPGPEQGIPDQPDAGQFVTTPAANVTLTLQSTLAGTVLADGTVVAAPGVPLIIKTLNNGNSAVPAETIGTTPGANLVSSWSGGAGFIVGVDDGTDPPTPNSTLIDDGAFSQIRILGIGGNTNQPRVPVYITSVYDDTVGTTVGTTVMNNVTASGTVPTAGNGGIIYFGGNSLTSYNLQDPRSGSIIDNADIRFMTRIEQQGGGIVYTVDRNGDGNYDATNDSPRFDRAGDGGYVTQYNAPKALTISDSNLFDFSDGGVVAHPGFGLLAVNTNYTVTPPGSTAKLFDYPTRISGINGEPTQTYLVNDTITYMTAGRGVGVDLISQVGDDNPGDVSVGSEAVILNSTFYGNGIGINSTAPAFTGTNPYSDLGFLAMDSIFANNTTAVQAVGDQEDSNLQYNLFNGNTTNLSAATAQFYDGAFNNSPYSGDPDFRNPVVNFKTNFATLGNLAGDFSLLANSAAIDRSRESLNYSTFGDMLSPAASPIRQVNANGTTGYNINFLPVRNLDNNVDLYGPGDGGSANDIVTLPGSSTTNRQFPDLWVATRNITPLPAVNSPNVVLANSSNPTNQGTVGNGYTGASVYGYVPIYGPRDQVGTVRGKDGASNNVGTGTNPFYDLGAFEYVLQTPPKVTAVTATTAAGTTSNLYVAGSVAGVNAYPSQIKVAISERLNASTVNANSVLLVGSGGDGTFGNANDITYSLANRISFDTTTNSIVINTAGLLPTGSALNDEYELVLKGTGQNIIRDNDGFALDGYTNGDTLPLPSGSDNLPGSDFSVMFTIDTNAPSLVAGSFGLAAGTYNTAAATAGAANVGSYVTNNNHPTFVGKITDIFPPANAIQGDTVFVDISTTGDPNNFDRIAAATGTTDANGNFSVTVTQALPDSPWTVGADGKQGTLDDYRPSLARVRVVDQAGNTSLLTTSPITSFVNAGATLAFEVDTAPPQVTSLTPTAGTLATINAAGQVVVTATFSKNIDPSTLNANSVLVYRAGGSGTFTGTGTPVTIVPGSFAITYLDSTTKGPVRVTFTLQGPLPNDFYRIVLKGTGTNPIRDIAGNALDGAGTGVAGSGDYTNTPFTVFTPTNARLIYVDNTTVYSIPTTNPPTLGSRENPYTTITAALAAAQTGDDVLVLPGTYREHITLKGQVRLLSANPTSTDTSFTPGNPLSTIIYGNTSTTPTFNSSPAGIVVQASNLTNVPGVPTEISGFTILAPLLGDSVRGVIDTTSQGIALINSNVLVDKNYIVNAGIGVNIATTGANVVAPQILDNVIAGNYSGVGISDQGSTTSYIQPTYIINNTIADNTYGIYNTTTLANVVQGYVINDIFYNNHDNSTARPGSAILSLAANTLVVGNSDFYQNGPSIAAASNASGVFAGFVPAALTATPDANGNILANPYFVNPEDPRPTGDTPPVFFLYANYDLTSRSPDINTANNVVAPATDILYRTPVFITGKGRTGTGPASIGAFYYLGTGGITSTSGNGTVTQVPAVIKAGSTAAANTASSVGGSLPIGTRQFAVVNTSLNPDGPVNGVATSISAPTSITVNFSDDIDTTTLTANDLKLSGSGLNSSNPAKATGLTWVDSHTVKFLLTGGFNPTGSVSLSIPSGAVKDGAGASIAAYAESFNLGTAVATTPATPVTPVTPAIATTTATPTTTPVSTTGTATVTIPIQPVAVAGPIAVHYTTPTAVSKNHSAKAHAAATAAAHKKAEAAKALAAKHAAAVAKAHKKNA